MIASRAPASVPRVACLSLVALLLAACAGHPQKPESVRTATTAPSAPVEHTRPARKPWKPLGPYTPGGLYAPGVADGAPDIPDDVANLPEPVPHAEPLSHYGNRTPYSVLGKTYAVLPSASGYRERGVASWYGTKFDGRATSNFEPYDMYQFTAAHRTLPLPSYARVTNLDNGRSVIVRVNDRGPFHEGRLIDLSYAAAVKLGVNVHGTANVEVRGIDPDEPLSLAPVARAATAHAAAPKGDLATTPGPSTRTAVRPTFATMPTAVAVAPISMVAGMPKGALSAADSATPHVSQPVAPLLNPAVAGPSSPATTTNAPATAASVSATPPPLAPQPTYPPASATRASNPLPTAEPPVTTTSEPPGRAPIEPSTLGFLQVASYSDRANAERMLQRLQKAGVEHAELVPVQVADQALWRVHIGPMRADDAEVVASHMDALGFGRPPFFKE